MKIKKILAVAAVMAMMTVTACGEYVFVFDDDTGECINKIMI